MGKGERRGRLDGEEDVITHGGGGFEVIYNGRDAYIGCYLTWRITWQLFIAKDEITIA